MPVTALKRATNVDYSLSSSWKEPGGRLLCVLPCPRPLCFASSLISRFCFVLFCFVLFCSATVSSFLRALSG